MGYRVVLADAAKADADRIYDWVAEMAPIRGPEWFEELISCLASLAEMPNRCPIAREVAGTAMAVRCLRFGRRPHIYRILYEVDEPQRVVWILHIRHGALGDLEQEEFGRSLQ